MKKMTDSKFEKISYSISLSSCFFFSPLNYTVQLLPQLWQQVLRPHTNNHVQKIKVEMQMRMLESAKVFVQSFDQQKTTTSPSNYLLPFHNEKIWTIFLGVQIDGMDKVLLIIGLLDQDWLHLKKTKKRLWALQCQVYFYSLHPAM